MQCNGLIMTIVITINFIHKLSSASCFTEFSAKCENGKLTDNIIWNNSKTLDLRYKDMQISCLEVTGRVKVLAGGISKRTISLECQSAFGCNIKVFTESKTTCKEVKYVELINWNSSEALELSYNDYKISCFEVAGAYEILSGGISHSFVKMLCLSSFNCQARVASYPFKPCENGQKVVVANWTNDEIFKLILENDEEITCFEVNGQYETLSGKNALNIFLLRCLSNQCSIDIYANYKSYQKSLIKCRRNSFSMTKTWNRTLPLTIKLEEFNIIECFDVDTPHKLMYGGLYQNVIVLECMSYTNCNVQVFVKNLFNDITGADSVQEQNVLHTKRSNNECTTGKIYLTRNWTYSHPIELSLKEKIHCFHVTGSYKTISGGVGYTSISLICLSLNCSIIIYVKDPYIMQSSQTSPSAKPERHMMIPQTMNGYCKIARGPRTKRIWDNKILLKYDSKNNEKILCLNVTGRHVVKEGGVGTSRVTIECLEHDGSECEVWVHTTEDFDQPSIGEDAGICK